MSDTITAIATGTAKTAIAIIRLSGENAFAIASRLFKPYAGKDIRYRAGRTIINGTIVTEKGMVLDHCLAIPFRAPASYTGEDSVELHCHGSPAVLNSALTLLLKYGARLAEPGEFTKRAFLNAKLDLVQAEAVADLIDAETESALLNSAAQLGGAISRSLEDIYDTFLDICSHFQAIIDYPDEDIDPFDEAKVLRNMKIAECKLIELYNSFEHGKIIKNGIKCTIIGKPNAGKSSLLNALLGYERAIVTAIPGTTRDTIEEKIVLGGILLRLTDTAGVRNTTDVIEAAGISRTLEAADSAALVLAVFDGSIPLSDDDFTAINAASRAPFSIAVINKADLGEVPETAKIEAAFKSVCRVSALNRQGLDSISNAVSSLFASSAPIPSGEVLTNIRQFEAVSEALNSVRTAITAAESGLTPDAALLDVEAAMSAIGRLNGRTLRDDIISRIFERFCVGK